MHEFEIDGTTFELAPLKLKQALKAQALLVQGLLPAALTISQAVRGGYVDPAALAGLERIEELVDLFAGQCKVDWNTGTQTARVPLPRFIDLVFSRRNAAMLAWLATCIDWQFADFFDGSGLPLVQQAASRFVSLLGSTGESGDL
jgi:hypothetical protein